MAIAFIASCDGFACTGFLVSAAVLSRRSWAGRAVMGGQPRRLGYRRCEGAADLAGAFDLEFQQRFVPRGALR
jgi:hypothetical protein